MSGEFNQPVALGVGTIEILTEGRPPVEHHDRVLLPLHSGLEVVAHADVIDQESQYQVCLLLLEPHYSFQEFAIQVDGPFAGNRMHANDGVDGVDGVAADEALACLSMSDHLLG